MLLLVGESINGHMSALSERKAICHAFGVWSDVLHHRMGRYYVLEFHVMAWGVIKFRSFQSWHGEVLGSGVSYHGMERY